MAFGEKVKVTWPDRSRGAGAPKLSLDEAIAVAGEREMDLVALDDALEGLAKVDPDQSRLVELR